jgi:hypothetical protein
MKTPRHPPGNPDRYLECQESLEAKILSILDEGRAAGWTTAEITSALIDLADHIMLADAANREVDKDIAAALRRIGL